VIRGEEMNNLVAAGKIQGKRDIGRQGEKTLDGGCRWLGVKDNTDIFRDVRDRTKMEKNDRQCLQAGHRMMKYMYGVHFS
jgi:hypothetical protein